MQLLQTMKKAIPFLVVLIGFAIGCKVDQSGVPTITNNAKLDGTWFLKTIIINGVTDNSPTAPDTLTNFTTTDYYKFTATNTYTKSTSAPVAVYNGNYSLLTSSGVQTLNVGAPGGSPSSAFTAYTVNKLSADSLILYTSASTTTAGVVITTYTTSVYTH